MEAPPNSWGKANKSRCLHSSVTENSVEWKKTISCNIEYSNLQSRGQPILQRFYSNAEFSYVIKPFAGWRGQRKSLYSYYKIKWWRVGRLSTIRFRAEHAENVAFIPSHFQRSASWSTTHVVHHVSVLAAWLRSICTSWTIASHLALRQYWTRLKALAA